jgi:N4-(beta-N-acetylglucosaminyl)-L-asparaginase
MLSVATWGFSKKPTEFIFSADYERAKEQQSADEEQLAGLTESTKRVVRAIELVEKDPEVHSVGIHSFPNKAGVLQLDAALIELKSQPDLSSSGKSSSARFGSIMGLEGYPGAIRGSSFVLRYSPHSYLCGPGGASFLAEQGYAPAAGPLPVMISSDEPVAPTNLTHPANHDTVGFVVCDSATGELSVGCSTSGLKGKHPGRVGDSPIFGSGLYGLAGVGGAVATGDGDTISTFPLCFVVVDEMRRGASPTEACKLAIAALLALPQTAPTAEVGVCALNGKGETGGWCSPAWSKTFQYVRGARPEGDSSPAVVDVVTVVVQ